MPILEGRFCTMVQEIRRGCRWFLAAAWLVVAMSCVRAEQAPAAAASFEVATIKPSDPNEVGGRLGFNEDRFMTTGQTVKSLMKFAYNLNFGTDQLISGGPSWVGTAKFDIQAKEGEQAWSCFPRKDVSWRQRRDQLQSMARELLADRFKLKVHHETKEIPVYAMTVAKGGLKMTPAVDEPRVAEGGKPPVGPGPNPPAPRSWHGLQGRRGQGQLEGKRREY